MGFERTADGRVFFQGSNDSKPEDEREEMSDERFSAVTPVAANEAAPRDENPNMQLQILQLLRGLNEKLQTTKTERDQMRRELNAAQKKLDQIEGRSQIVDEQYGSLLEQAEHHKQVSLEMSRKQARLEQYQKENDYATLAERISANEEKQDALNVKVTEAMSQQDALMEKLDQAMQERARFMRKIELIEETVLQTRDAIHSHNILPQLSVNNHPRIGVSTPAAATMAMDNVSSSAFSLKTVLAFVGIAGVAAILGIWVARGMPVPDVSLPSVKAPIQTSAQPAAPKVVEMVAKESPKWRVREDTRAFGDPSVVLPAQEAVAPVEQAPAQETIVEEDAATTLLPSPSQEDLQATIHEIKRDKSLPEALRVIEDEAFSGVAEAQHDLAAVYTAGHGGMAQNYDKALYWFEQSALGGVANAAYNLGVIYHQGLAGEKNIDLAMKWYRKAAELKHPEAQYNLGIAYIEGIGVPYDAAKAADFFEKAALQNVTEAAYNLGLIYENGLLGLTKPQEAMYWYKKAADQGSPEAKVALTSLTQKLGVSEGDIDTDRIAPDESEKVLKNLTAQVQDFLGNAGLYPGPADGMNGPMTMDAVRSYQAIHNMEITGEIDAALLNHMLANKENPLTPAQGSGF